MKTSLVKAVTVITLAAFISACGNTKGQRALSGGAIGAGVGAVGAAVINANPVTGAVVGAAAGAATGALTKKKHIDLGDIN